MKQKTKLTGTVIRPDDPEYPLARRNWNPFHVKVDKSRGIAIVQAGIRVGALVRKLAQIGFR